MSGKKSITTGVGDKGMTLLFSGEQVPKDSPRCGVIGDIDELVSVLGVARCHANYPEVKEAVLELQRELFVVGAEIATTEDYLEKLDKRVDEAMLRDLDDRRHMVENQVTVPDGFLIPGNTASSAYLDQARSIARRCERGIVALSRPGGLHNEDLLVWINRVSDYLWLLARLEEETQTPVKE